MSSRSGADQGTERTFFGQPRLLVNLFGVEMWERFSFYGMQGILLIYLYYSVADGGLDIDQDEATSIVGAYGGLLYLAAILGAWLADRVLGPERVLFLSAVLVMIGHIALSVLPGLLGVGVGLVCIALGGGGVKATATSMVGTLYSRDDPRRDAGFSIYYSGINLGALLGPILTGIVQSTAGFHWGFGLAAVGMAIGLTQYTLGRRRFPEAARTVPDPLPADRRARFVFGGVAGVAVIVVLALTGVLNADSLSNVVVVLTVLAAVAYFTIILTSRHISTVERRRMLAFIPLFITSVAFWSLYQQQFTVLTIYSDQRLDREILGWTMPVSWIQAINPIFIIVLAGAFAAVWTKLGDRQPSAPIKFASATVVMGAAFLLFIPISGGGPNSAPLLALVGILFLFTIAELLISPVGLSLATKIAPAAFRTQTVALFFLSLAIGTALSGTLATDYDPNNEAPYFAVLGIVAIVIGLALAAAYRPINRLMGGVR